MYYDKWDKVPSETRELIERIIEENHIDAKIFAIIEVIIDKLSYPARDNNGRLSIMGRTFRSTYRIPYNGDYTVFYSRTVYNPFQEEYTISFYHKDSLDLSWYIYFQVSEIGEVLF